MVFRRWHWSHPGSNTLFLLKYKRSKTLEKPFGGYGKVATLEKKAVKVAIFFLSPKPTVSFQKSGFFTLSVVETKNFEGEGVNRV